MKRMIALAAILALAPHPASAQAQRSIFGRAKTIYAVMDLRVNTLRQCAKLDPPNRSKYEAEVQRYQRETKPLLEKVRQIIIAEVPGKPAAASLGVVELWSADESRKNMSFQTARQQQFMEKCDYAINPAGRARYRLTAQWNAAVVGLPGDEYPEDVKAINAWKP